MQYKYTGGKMASNLRDRLRRIQEIKKNPVNVPHEIKFENSGWQSCGFQTLRRDVVVDTPLKTQPCPQSLPILVPDLSLKSLPSPEDFLFFDLETTGLSGGAGTVAFLAAFGRAVSGGKLRITQYLLLDYPGENDFLEAVLAEFKNKSSVIVSYNGKCFDSQILKTRCLMKRIKPPEYSHADLLHPARRLWKNILGSCSQGSVETGILGLDRSGDTPGALAPEIWFDFLKTGRTERLMGICDHNCSDISGLAAMLAAMIAIAADPFTVKINYDLQRLALYWRGFTNKQNAIPPSELSALRQTGKRLLRLASEKNYPRAALVYALDEMSAGNYQDGRKRLLSAAESDFPENIKAAAFRTLAIDSERRLKDIPAALDFARRGLELYPADSSLRAGFELRVQRLEKKLSRSGL
jgi:uncharacterized protein YprB with RNaseH-like and TPR domain